MNFERFKIEMAKAKTFIDLGERPEYYMGYMRGLRRQYHGETFGTDAEHEKWLALADEDMRDQARTDRGRGYRAGFDRD